MTKFYIGTEHIPPLPDASKLFMLGVQDIFSMMRIIGAEIRDGIRYYTPKSSGGVWRLYRKCKVVSWRATTWTARVRIGWVRSDFPRGQFYAVFVGEGTGVYGNRSKYIYPKKKEKGVPIIRYQYNGRWVSVRRSRGQKPQRLLEKGYERALPMVLMLMSRTMFRTMRVYKHA